MRARRNPQLSIDTQHRIDATARAARGDADQLPGRRLGKIRREVRRHEHLKRLGHFARRLVVVVDRRELISQILLQHSFHMGRQPAQLLFDLLALGPDPRGDEQLIEIRQMHE